MYECKGLDYDLSDSRADLKAKVNQELHIIYSPIGLPLSSAVAVDILDNLLGGIIGKERYITF